jgi:U3 small nucleolar RNA-associated protein 14
VEEVAARRAELRKMRDLMFRAELKARRANKIKSKTYRKLRRKEKERLAEQIDEEEDSQDEEVQMKRALDRAKERATLRHKHTGKWARQMKKGHLDEDQRKEISEMLSKGEKLRQKIQGVGSDESDEDESSDDDDMGPEEAVEKIKQSAFDELRQLREEDDDVPESSGKKGKSVFEMKFMKDAMARHQAESNREVDDFIKELGAQQDGSNDEGDDDDEHDPSSGVVVRRANGRVVYRPGGPVSALHFSRPTPCTNYRASRRSLQ